MGRPRILLVPDLTEIEWGIRPLLEEWAEVASFDAPGVGDQPVSESVDGDTIAGRGLAELDDRGWDRVVVVSDGYANYSALQLACLRANAVDGMALGHACLSLSSEGERPPRTPGLFEVLLQLARTDYGAFRRALTQITTGSFDDEMVDRVTERVPQGVAERYLEWFEAKGQALRLDDKLRKLGVPLLFAEHQGCIQWTREGYEDAVAAFPQAQTVTCNLKPSVDPAFAGALRSFCGRLAAERASRPA